MLVDLDFDIEVMQRGPVGRGKETPGCCSVASCCCCSCRAEVPADGFADTRG